MTPPNTSDADPDDDQGIAVGTPFYSRTTALQNLLKSIPDYVTTVYIADNGPADPTDAYPDTHGYTIESLTLPFDAGIGACRRAITDVVEEPYLFMCDSDMELIHSNDLKTLKQILTQHSDVGAAAAWLIEPPTVRAGARNLKEVNGTAIKHVPTNPGVTRDPVPFATFEFIPQSCLFKTEVFDDYTYDPDIRSSEHFDFFYGHKHHDTGWTWASTPTVQVVHNRNIDMEYRETRGQNHMDLEQTAEKWGITNIVPGAYAEWNDNHDRTVFEDAFDLFRRKTPASVWLPTRTLLHRVVG